MSQQLKTWINPAIDTGERFAEAVIEDVECPEDDEPLGIEVDGHVILFNVPTNVRRCREHVVEVKRVIAAAYEAGREQGREEGKRAERNRNQ